MATKAEIRELDRQQMFWVQHVLQQGDDLRAIPAGKTLEGAKKLARKLAKETHWNHIVITLLPNGETPVLFEATRTQ